MTYGQEKKAKSILTFKPGFSLYAISPKNFGDNYLAKANKPDIGIGANFHIVKIYGFELGMGYDYNYYSITDVTKAGNIKSSRYNAVYSLLGYEIDLIKELSLQPYVGFGAVKLNFKSRSRSFGHQTGNDFRVGLNLNYNLDKTISVFGGFGYVSSIYDVQTSPEFVSFYDNSKMIQINIGFKLN
jgi:hypothetical protein